MYKDWHGCQVWMHPCPCTRVGMGAKSGCIHAHVQGLAWVPSLDASIPMYKDWHGCQVLMHPCPCTRIGMCLNPTNGTGQVWIHQCPFFALAWGIKNRYDCIKPTGTSLYVPVCFSWAWCAGAKFVCACPTNGKDTKPACIHVPK